jgi:hypothetical protein
MPKLIIRENGAERTMQISADQITIGRAADNQVTIDDAKASRNHCVIKVTEEGASLIDLESSNGTKLNDQPVTKEKLKEGDQIQIGRAVIVFSYEEEEEEDEGEEEVVEGIEEEDTGARRAIRFRRNLRNRNRGARPKLGRTGPVPTIKRPPTEAVKPLPPATPVPPPAKPTVRINLGGGGETADTKVEPKEPEKKEVKPAAPIPAPVDETKVEPPPRKEESRIQAAARPPAAPVPHPEGRTNVKKFYLVDQGKVRMFSRESAPGAVAPLPLSNVFSETCEAVPWEEIFKMESVTAENGFEGARAAMLFTVRDPDAQGEGSTILVDTAGVVTVIESADEGRSTSQITGRAINLAATVAIEWSAESLQKEFDSFCSRSGRLSADYLRTRLGRAPAADFWKKVEANLQAGRIRVMFVVREPTVAIQKVIDFLHGKTSMAAYAIQLELYQERGVERPRTAFSARVLEPSKAARVPKGSNPALDVVTT